ncbi:hypothetical protein, partial [Corallococcus carmarthensis]|uniref:hypothetical protein n=1 Tax=Corallococcus carmarthensis TaxID=2316728 RepID=UPI001C1216AE
MAISITEIIEDGIPYRITKDDETGLYMKESLQEPLPPPPPGPSKIELLEAEISSLNMQNIELWEILITKGVV